MHWLLFYIFLSSSLSNSRICLFFFSMYSNVWELLVLIYSIRVFFSFLTFGCCFSPPCTRSSFSITEKGEGVMSAPRCWAIIPR